MYDIAIGTVGILLARHNDEVSLPRIDNLNVMHCESPVKCYRGNCLHRSVIVEHLSDFDIRNSHSVLLAFCFSTIYYRTAVRTVQNDYSSDSLTIIMKYCELLKSLFEFFY